MKEPSENRTQDITIAVKPSVYDELTKVVNLIGLSYEELINVVLEAFVDNGKRILENELKPTQTRDLPKGFIKVKGAYIRTDKIVGVRKHLCVDHKCRTLIEAGTNEYYADETIDEVMAKIEVALNG